MPSIWANTEANYNTCYAVWLDELDRICDHFLSIRFADLTHMGDLDPHDAFYEFHATPEQFFKDAVLPYCENEHGAEFIYEMIADNIMWGSGPPEPR